MINEEYNETAGVYKVQTFGTTQITPNKNTSAIRKHRSIQLLKANCLDKTE